MPPAGLDDAFQIVEPRGPENAVMLEPSLDFPERRGVEGVEPGLRHPSLTDQSGAPQHAEVPGDSGPAHREEAGDLTGRALLAAKGIEDGPPGGIGNRGKDERSFCNHTVT